MIAGPGWATTNSAAPTRERSRACADDCIPTANVRTVVGAVAAALVQLDRRAENEALYDGRAQRGYMLAVARTFAPINVMPAKRAFGLGRTFRGPGFPLTPE